MIDLLHSLSQLRTNKKMLSVDVTIVLLAFVAQTHTEKLLGKHPATVQDMDKLVGKSAFSLSNPARQASLLHHGDLNKKTLEEEDSHGEESVQQQNTEAESGKAAMSEKVASKKNATRISKKKKKKTLKKKKERKQKKEEEEDECSPIKEYFRQRKKEKKVKKEKEEEEKERRGENDDDDWTVPEWAILAREAAQRQIKEVEKEKLAHRRVLEEKAKHKASEIEMAPHEYGNGLHSKKNDLGYVFAKVEKVNTFIRPERLKSSERAPLTDRMTILALLAPNLTAREQHDAHLAYLERLRKESADPNNLGKGSWFMSDFDRVHAEPFNPTKFVAQFHKKRKPKEIRVPPIPIRSPEDFRQMMALELRKRFYQDMEVQVQPKPGRYENQGYKKRPEDLVHPWEEDGNKVEWDATEEFLRQKNAPETLEYWKALQGLPNGAKIDQTILWKALVEGKEYWKSEKPGANGQAMQIEERDANGQAMEIEKSHPLRDFAYSDEPRLGATNDQQVPVEYAKMVSQTSPKVISLPAAALIGVFVGSGVAFAFIRY